VAISDIAELMDDAASLLKPGGVSTHLVDLEDHRDPQNNPFAMLAPVDGKGAWADLDRGNRLRFSTWRSILDKQTHMEWRFPYVAVRHDASLPTAIDPAIDCADEEDLRTSAFVAVGRRVR
jgi:hypothetical protein